jgi:predicted porin
MMMQKKIGALALAAGLVAPLASFADSANVTVYGVANLSYDFTDNGDTATAKGIKTSKVSSNASRIGFKGSEDLDDGLSAVWQIESRVDIDNAGGGFATRNSFAGLSDKTWGTLVMGRHDTPYKLATGSLDLFRDSMGDNRALMGGVKGKSSFYKFDDRSPDIVLYTSPSWSGIKLLAARVAGAETADTSTQSKGQIWSLAGFYDNGPLFASLAYQKNDFGSAGTGTMAGTADTSETAWKLGVGYKFEMIDLGLAYETTQDDINTVAPTACTTGSTDKNCYGHNALYVSGKYKLASSAIKLAYGKAGNLGNKADSGADQMILGYDYNLRKRTILYGIYTKLNNDKNASYGIAAGDAGINTGFVTAKGAGADPSAWSFGIKHSF